MDSTFSDLKIVLSVRSKVETKQTSYCNNMVLIDEDIFFTLERSMQVLTKLEVVSAEQK